MGKIVKRQAANFAIALKRTTFKRILSQCRANTPADMATRIRDEMRYYPGLNKILEQSTYYGDGSYLPLMRLTSLL